MHDDSPLSPHHRCGENKNKGNVRMWQIAMAESIPATLPSQPLEGTVRRSLHGVSNVGDKAAIPLRKWRHRGPDMAMVVRVGFYFEKWIQPFFISNK